MIALRQLFLTRRQLVVLLAAVFGANLVETQVEEALKSPATYALGYRIAQAFHELEGGFNFTGADRLSWWVVSGYTFSYFVLFPLLLVGMAVALGRREKPGAFRVLAFGITITYLLAVPFFLYFPVPERWAFPGARATLLSDYLSTSLIELYRPLSGLDNCFPSLHAAMSTLVVLLAYWTHSRWRHCLACLAGVVMVSTFFVGIHWLPDMAMGIAVAGIGFGLAVRLNQEWYAEGRPPREPARVPGTRAGLRASSRSPLRAGSRSPLRSGSRSPWRTGAPFPFARPPLQRQVFISYRRDGGSGLARVVQMELERRGYPCFLDVDDLGAEHFDERLLREIEEAPNFVLILVPGSFDRCRQPDDWMRREIVHALKHERNIVPLVAEGFQFPALAEIPRELQSLQRLNAVVYSHDYFNASFDRLEEFLNTGEE